MVRLEERLEEVEDEHYHEKTATTRDGALIAEDDDDYTDTDSEISDASSVADDESLEETLYDRLVALKDMVPPKTRAKLSTISSTIYNTTSTGITYSGKGLWILATSVLLLGLPYALAIGEEQGFQEEERARLQMQEGAQGLIGSGSEGGEARPSL